MRLIQPLKFRTLKMGCFKMPHLQMAIFQMGIIVASGLRLTTQAIHLKLPSPFLKSGLQLPLGTVLCVFIEFTAQCEKEKNQTDL